MKLFAALAAALHAFAVAYPIAISRKLEKEIAEYEEEIMALAESGAPDHQLRLEILAKRKQRADESLRALRSASSHADEG